MATRTPGTLTLGTDKPAYPPWFVDDTPSNGKGFESAVAFAVAKKLGFEAVDVQWVTVPFNNAITPGKKAFDVDINQVSISEERRKAVDFSTGYYDVAQAVITYKGSPIDGKTAVADLAGAKKVLKFLPGRDKLQQYFARYQSAQTQLDAIIKALAEFKGVGRRFQRYGEVASPPKT